jgi:3-hydroxyisobutyrate dehydrogenase
VANVGFVGLGAMGSAMAKRLLDAGHTVHGYNRTPEKAQWLVELGLVPVETPREAAERADEVVFSMVTNTSALNAIARGPDGILAGLAPGKVYVDSSTASPANTRALAADVEALGAHMLDAPVSGAPVAIEQGTASLIVGGDPEAFERAEPILRDVARARRIGDNGQALLLKIAINFSLLVQMTAFSEGLLLAEKAGIDKELALTAMLDSVAASPMLKYRAPLVLEQPEEAWFDCNMMQKDMNLALEAGREYGVPMLTAGVTNELMTAARGMGLDHRDFSIVYDVLAAMAGMKGTVA